MKIKERSHTVVGPFLHQAFQDLVHLSSVLKLDSNLSLLYIRINVYFECQNLLIITFHRTVFNNIISQPWCPQSLVVLLLKWSKNTCFIEWYFDTKLLKQVLLSLQVQSWGYSDRYYIRCLSKYWLTAKMLNIFCLFVDKFFSLRNVVFMKEILVRKYLFVRPNIVKHILFK